MQHGGHDTTLKGRTTIVGTSATLLLRERTKVGVELFVSLAMVNEGHIDKIDIYL